MRVTRFLACLIGAVGLGLVAAPVSAQPAGRLDVEPILAALRDGQRIIRVPGSVAVFDQAMVGAELGSTTRLVLLPYVDYELYRDENDESEYYDLVRRPIQDWAHDRDTPVVIVEGLDVSMVNGPSTMDHRLPADLDELRTTTATRVITERLVVFARLARGLDPDAAENVAIEHPPPVPADPERVAELVAALRENRIHNAPGRTDPIADWLVERTREDYGIDIRVAAFPRLEPGQPVVDYVTPLGAAFPDDVVLVVHGDWFDIAAPDQRKARAAHAFAYGDADLGLLTSGAGVNTMLRQTVERYELLMTETSWGYPQPPPQPRAVPFDVRRTVSALAPWVLIGSAVVLGGAGVLRHRARSSAEAVVEERALRAESAAAMATIGDLGARVLAAEEDGGRADAAVAERHATARLLYDQAFTSVAMVEVRRVAEEGLALLTEPEPEPDRTPEPARRSTSRPGSRPGSRSGRANRGRRGKKKSR